MIERTFDRGEKRYSCLKSEDTSDGLLLNISACTPGEPVNTIPHPNDDTSAEPEIVDAPQNRDFMDGDSFALIHENHALVCSVSDAHRMASVLGINLGYVLTVLEDRITDGRVALTHPV